MSVSKLNILITGGSGFLGSALAHHFQRLGHKVALLLRPGSRLNRFKDCDIRTFNICRCGTDEEIDYFVGNIAPHIIMHTACSYGLSDENLISLVDTNLRFGLLLLEATRSFKHPVTFMNAGTALEPTVSDYSLSKKQFDIWAKRFAAESGGKFQFINVLLQHMYGPGDDPSRFIAHVLKACSENQPTLDLTLGEQSRDFVYIADVISAYATLVKQRHTLRQIEDIELGSGDALSVRELVETIHKITNSKTLLKFGSIPYRPNEAMFCKANITKLNQMGWTPIYNFVSGIKEIIELGI